ncbi:hypothetical protein MAMMFC1_02912 [Methylomusa anaerophila]|uniref:Uncharacterized protein n=1 Tax=Methylomusa anaerophila TaxID=1930071 RepID=A0A348AMC9_9FIRM|nr:hypothetical protein MAMMFC1_02912 [Methylomusa anaerophila]
MKNLARCLYLIVLKLLKKRFVEYATPFDLIWRTVSLVMAKCMISQNIKSIYP